MTRLLLLPLAALLATSSVSAQPQVCDIGGGFTITQSTIRANPGDSVTLSYTFGNSGTIACPELAVGFYLSTDTYVSTDDVLLGTGTLPATNPQTNAGSSGTVVVPEGTPRGGYRFLVVADYLDEVDELSEGNNVNFGRLTVGGDLNGPNLVVATAMLEDASAAPGDRVSFDYSVQNQGQSGTSDISIGFYLRPINGPISSWIPLGSEIIGGIGAGQTERENEQVTIPRTVPPARYALLVVADDGNAIEESDETDNVLGAGLITITGSTAGEAEPGASALSLAASPNPASASVQLSYTLTEARTVRISVVTRWAVRSRSLTAPVARAPTPRRSTRRRGHRACTSHASQPAARQQCRRSPLRDRRRTGWRPNRSARTGWGAFPCLQTMVAGARLDAASRRNGRIV